MAHNNAASAILPFARNDLTSDLNGNLSRGAGFADSYYLPLILGWGEERAAVRVLWGFLAPSGGFAQGANSNVGCGYWTFTGSSAQTFYLTKSKSLNLSAYEMYEFHTTQEGTGRRIVLSCLRSTRWPLALERFLTGRSRKETETLCSRISLR